jgi:hypothetical protein
MKDSFQRLDYKAKYGPLATKKLENILKRELMEQFGFENMGLIADSLISRFLEIVAEYTPEQKRILPGQVLWLAVAEDERTAPGKPLWKSRLVPVILTVVSSEDLESMANEGKNHMLMRPYVVARMLKEAKSQGGVLGLHDVAVLLGISQSQVTRAVDDYHKEHPGEVLPYRGTIHDMGKTVTHKVQAVELKLRGLLTREIARRLHHDPSCIDVYLNDFERVYYLHKDGKAIKQISFLTKIAPSVVQQYIHLIESYMEESSNSDECEKRKK